MAREWLKEKRKAKGLSTFQVARALGMSQSHYSMIEAGTRRPSVEKAKKIGDFLKFDWARFYE